jgi:hypothetical protein
METWQERMAQRAKEAAWYATLSGANGWCTDEGEKRTDWKGLHPVMNRLAEDRPAGFEYSRLDALTVARSGYMGEVVQAFANSKDRKLQMAVADFLAQPDAAKRAGVTVVVDVTEQQLGKAEFFARRAAGVEVLMRHGRFATRRDAELEWMEHEAVSETGFTRDEPNPSRRRKFLRVYRNLCNRDRK